MDRQKWSLNTHLTEKTDEENRNQAIANSKKSKFQAQCLGCASAVNSPLCTHVHFYMQWLTPDLSLRPPANSSPNSLSELIPDYSLL